MELKNKKVLVVGTGISGVAATSLICSHNGKVTLLDGNEKLNKEDIRKQIPEEYPVEIIIGDIKEEELQSFDYVVLSPGVPTDLPFIEYVRNLGTPILGEIELAYAFEPGRVVGITGTNGKTTTTALTGAIMKTYFDSVQVVGNIGLPYTSMVTENTKDSVTVAELSSFQLETVSEFHPVVSAILNITPDHLNRHHTMENYIAAKCNITKNQTAEDTCVLNYEDEVLQKFGETLTCKVCYFSSKRILEKGIYLNDETIFWADGETVTKICDVKELLLLGTHNYENVMAAVAMAIAMKVPFDCIRKAITSFHAVEHRIEFVKEVNGVKYYNDSKGTNPDAAIKGIQAMTTKTCLIGGGYDKDSEYDEWIQSFDGKVKCLVLLGQTREKIAKAARNNGFNDIILVDSLEEAVDTCYRLAEPGESVLLSPACASWGMFKNYEQRGDMFKELVRNLPSEE